MTKEELIQLSKINNPLYKKERWVTIEEAELLVKLATEAKPDIILESGTANGYSAAWLSLVAPVVTFDPYSRPKIWIGDEPITYINDVFSSVTSLYDKFDGKKFFFIDGGHDSSSVKDDTDAIKQIAKPGDEIVFHDLDTISVLRFWHRMVDYAIHQEKYNTKRTMGRIVWR